MHEVDLKVVEKIVTLVCMANREIARHTAAVIPAANRTMPVSWKLKEKHWSVVYLTNHANPYQNLTTIPPLSHLYMITVSS